MLSIQFPKMRLASQAREAMAKYAQIDLFTLYISILLGFAIGIDPPRILNSERLRISMMFFTGSTLFAQALKLELSHDSTIHFGLWLLVLMISGLIGKLVFDPENRTYAPLVGASIFTGALLGAGELIPSVVATIVYPTLLALLRFSPEEFPSKRRYIHSSKLVYVSAILILLMSVVGAFWEIDGKMTEAIRNATSPMSAAMSVLAHIVEARFLLPTCFIVFGVLWFKNRRASFIPLLAMSAWGAGEGVSFLLKHWLARPRPEILHHLGSTVIQPQFFYWGHGPAYVGFPSAHATAYFALAWITSNLSQRHPHLRWLALFAAAGLSLGRVTLEKHFFADIVAAAAIGVICAQLVLEQAKYCIAKQMH
jgi:membrane-associated phospholipid phosphatase